MEEILQILYDMGSPVGNLRGAARGRQLYHWVNCLTDIGRGNLATARWRTFGERDGGRNIPLCTVFVFLRILAELFDLCRAQ